MIFVEPAPQKAMRKTVALGGFQADVNPADYTFSPGAAMLGVVRRTSDHASTSPQPSRDATPPNWTPSSRRPCRTCNLLITQRQAFGLTRLAHELQNPLLGIEGAADRGES
jgi:hypothetical protein